MNKKKDESNSLKEGEILRKNLQKVYRALKNNEIIPKELEHLKDVIEIHEEENH